MEKSVYTIYFLGVTLPQWLVELYRESLDKGYPLEVHQVRRFIRVLENRSTSFSSYILEADLVNCSRVFLEAIDDEVNVCSISNLMPYAIVLDKHVSIDTRSGVFGVKNELVLKTPRFTRELLLKLYMLPEEYRAYVNNVVINSMLSNNPEAVSRSFVVTGILYLEVSGKVDDLKDIVWGNKTISSVELVVPKRITTFYRILKMLGLRDLLTIEQQSLIQNRVDYFKFKVQRISYDVVLDAVLLGSLSTLVKTYFNLFVDVFRRTRNIYTSTMASLYEKPFMSIFVTSSILKKLVRIYPSYIDLISYIDRFLQELRSSETFPQLLAGSSQDLARLELVSKIHSLVDNEIAGYVKGIREAVSDTAETLITQIQSLGTLIQLQRTVSALIVTSIGILVNLLRMLLIEILKVF